MDNPLPASSADPSPAILAQAFDAAANGFILISADGAIASVNQELSRMFGHPAKWLIGRSVDILLPEVLRAQHVEHRRQFLAAPSQRRMGEGRGLNGQHALGHAFPVEIGLTPLLTPSGERMVLAAVPPEDQLRCEQAGMCDVIAKPIIAEHLMETLPRWIPTRTGA